jgi:hypothetical protein
MRVKSTVVLGVMLWSFAVSVPVWAQQYDARRNGDVVQLEDKKNETVVSIITSVGMMAYEMKVKGQNVLRFPFKSIDEFQGEAGGPARHSAARAVGESPRRAGVLRQRQTLCVRHEPRQT